MTPETNENVNVWDGFPRKNPVQIRHGPGWAFRPCGPRSLFETAANRPRRGPQLPEVDDQKDKKARMNWWQGEPLTHVHEVHELASVDECRRTELRERRSGGSMYQAARSLARA